MATILAAIITRARTVMSMLVFILVAGAIAYVDIPKEADPEVASPIVAVNVALEGVSPFDAERLLVRPLEEQFADLEGLDKIQARAFQGGANITLKFDPSTVTEVALREVREKIDMARPEMPLDIEEPIVEEINVSVYAVMIVTLSGDLAERTLLRHARNLRDEVAKVPGVLTADLVGAREETLELIVDPARAESYRLNIDDLARVVSRANRLVAAGRIDTGQGSFSVSVPGLFESADDVLNMPVKVSGNAVVRIRDIAEIRRTFKDPQSIVRVNGKRALTLEIKKRTGANIINTTEAVRRMLDQISSKWPESLVATIVLDVSRNVITQFTTLQNNVLLAVFLVMALVIAALGVRSGLLVGVAIPGSFLAGILALYWLNITISIVVMFGLIIAVGILVDGAIVVTEYADRKMVEGLERREAYVLAAQRMAWPIISSTATTIAAFVPLLFWPGILGQVLGFLPITLICVLTGSLAMALFFIPTLGSLVGSPSDIDHVAMEALSGTEKLNLGKLKGVTRRYVLFLSRALQHPGKILLGTAGLLIVVPVAYYYTGNGLMFYPNRDTGRASMIIHALGNLSMEEKDSLVHQVEQRILDQVGLAEFDAMYVRAGASNEEATTDVIGQIWFYLKAYRERRSISDIIAHIKKATKGIPGIRLDINEWNTVISGKPIQLEVSSANHKLMVDAVVHIRRGMDELGGFASVEDTRPLPGIEWRLEVERGQAARFGADLTSVGSAVRMITNGLKLGTYRPDDSDDEIDILVRYPEAYRSVSQLDELRLKTTKGLVPISNFVRRIAVQQETELLRIDRRRVMKVEASVEPGNLPNNLIVALRAWLKDNPLDPRVRLKYAGEQEEQGESSTFLLFAFALALFLMAAILLIQFNSFYSVFLILSSVILSTIGVLLGYIIIGQPFVVVMSGIGLIALAGIVVNNNIVLIDTYDRLKQAAPTTFDALIQTGAQRLRPVFLTTTTTALGLLPMALIISIDFFSRSITFSAPELMLWQQLAITIIFGLIFSSVLTLVVTPCALMLKNRHRSPRATPDLPTKGRPAIEVPAE
jgi:multidrug efflux pump